MFYLIFFIYFTMPCKYLPVGSHYPELLAIGERNYIQDNFPIIKFVRDEY